MSARHISNRRSCPLWASTLWIIVTADWDVLCHLWLEGNMTLRGPSELQLSLAGIHGARRSSALAQVVPALPWMCIKAADENTKQSKNSQKIAKMMIFKNNYWLGFFFQVFVFLLILPLRRDTMNLTSWHLARTDDITPAGGAARASVFSDLITCWTRAVDLITAPFEAAFRQLMVNLWVRNAGKMGGNWNVFASVTALWKWRIDAEGQGCRSLYIAFPPDGKNLWSHLGFNSFAIHFFSCQTIYSDRLLNKGVYVIKRQQRKLTVILMTSEIKIKPVFPVSAESHHAD